MNLVLVVLWSLAMPCCRFRPMASCLSTVWVCVIIVCKMLYQLSVVNPDEYSRNCSLVRGARLLTRCLSWFKSAEVKLKKNSSSILLNFRPIKNVIFLQICFIQSCFKTLYSALVKVSIDLLLAVDSALSFFFDRCCLRGPRRSEHVPVVSSQSCPGCVPDPEGPPLNLMRLSAGIKLALLSVCDSTFYLHSL